MRILPDISGSTEKSKCGEERENHEKEMDCCIDLLYNVGGGCGLRRKTDV